MQLVSYAFAMVMTVAILFGSGLLLESVSDEKENRMVEIILTSVSPLGLMAGKVLAQGALALAQVVLWVGSLAIIGPRIFDQLPEVSDLSIEAGQLVWLLLFFLAGYFVVAVVMAGLGAMTSSYTQSSQLSALVIVPVILPVAAPQFILESPDGGLARVLSFIPVTAPTTVVMRMGQTDLSIAELLASLTVVRSQRRRTPLRLRAHIPRGDTPVRAANDHSAACSERCGRGSGVECQGRVAGTPDHASSLHLCFGNMLCYRGVTSWIGCGRQF